MRTGSLINRCIAVTIGAAILGAAAPAAQAATFDVTRTDDPVPNGCQPADCSLREAVIAANAAGTHEIRLTSGSTYTLSIPGDESIPTSGALNANGSMRIVTTGAGPATIDGNGDVTGNRALEVGIAPASVRLENIVVTGGRAPVDGTNNARGGGIRVFGRFTMLGGQIVDNDATRNAPLNGLGGGLYSAGTTTLDNVRIAANTAVGTGGFGGGVYVAGGTTTITDSVLRSNGGLFGGALSGDGGATDITNTRIGGNGATANGGALFAINGAEFNLHNVNVDHNGAVDSAGGIRARDATVRLRNTTVTANAAPVAGGISVQDAPGGDDGSIRLANSLIAGNSGSADAPDCLDQTGGQVTTSGYNLIGDMGGGSCSILAQPGDRFGNTGPGVPAIDPRLDTEKHNGGPLLDDDLFLTNALLGGSPAINAGAPSPSSPIPCEGTDARGVPRSLGGRCDIGAYERVKCQKALVNRVGTDGADSSRASNLQPTSGRDGYLGLGGKDKLSGGGGKDGLCGGAGKDKLRGNGGKDRLDGGPGRDVCIGGPGKDKARRCEVTRSIP